MRGFTLVEVMVALFIMAVMAGLAWRGIDAIARTRSVVQDKMERLQRLQAVLAQWEADLRQAHDTRVVPGLEFDGATLRLTRKHPAGVQLVAWTLRNNGLHRWASAPVTGSSALQDQWMASLQLQGGEPGHVHMLGGLSQWQLYVFHRSSSAWSNAQSSGDVTSQGGGKDTHTELPDGVRAIFTFGPGSTAEGTVTRDIQIVHP